MNKALALAAIGEARKNYHGNTVAAIGNLHPIAVLFEGEAEENVEVLDADWGGGFVYLCLRLAGITLPPRYPDPRIGMSFARAEAWERYAKLPKIVRHFRTKQVKILCDKPTCINLDGELRTAQEVVFSIAEEKLRFFYPKELTWQAQTPVGAK